MPPAPPGGLSANLLAGADGLSAVGPMEPARRVADDAGVSAEVSIVDDNARFRVWPRRWLEANGYTVVAEAADCAAALEAARRVRPSVVLVVLLDVSLPDMRAGGGRAPGAEPRPRRSC